MKQLNELEYPGFLRAFLGLMMEPGATTEALFQKEPPAYIIRMLLLFFFTLLLPILLAFAFKEHAEVSEYEMKNFITLVGVALLTIVFFVAVEGILLLILGYDISPLTITAITTYAVSPVIVMVLVLYSFSYISSGQLLLADALLTGNFVAGGYYIRVLPYVVGITQVAMLYIFFWGIVNGCGASYLSGFAVFLVSMVPLVMSFSLAVYAIGQVVPGSSDLLMDFVRMPLNLQVLKGSGG